MLGQNDQLDFLGFDFRNTKSPIIGPETIEFFMFGDFLHEENDCYDLSPEEMDFLNGHLSQLAVSEASATCFMEQIGYSHVGTITLTKDSLN